MTETESDRIRRIALERASRERTGAPNIGGEYVRRKRVTTSEGSRYLAMCRTEDPIAMVKAAQMTYLRFESLGLLDAITRRTLTADYEAAINAVYRAGLKSQLRDASWPPVRQERDEL